LRYLDPHNDKELCSAELQKQWLPVDLYIGGAEHAVLHLLYARFWHKVLYDLGIVSTKEPFHKLVNQGMILGDNNEKMSKSRGNVINPDQIVNEFGGDTLRMYEMFMGPLESTKPWNVSGVEGIYRFFNRVWRLFINEEDGKMNSKIVASPADGQSNEAFKRTWHRSIKKITEDYEALRFNTAISQMMIFINEAYKTEELPMAAMVQFVQLLSPIAPHIAEELWEQLGQKSSLTYEPWPAFDEAWIEDNEVEIVVQVNGKIIERVSISREMEESAMQELAQNLIKVQEAMAGKTIRKVIVVKGKLVNLVVG
jgi:leucyl-tRNA synthetase